MVCCLHQLLSRDKAKGECGREECIRLAKLTVTHKGVCVVVVRKVTLLRKTTWCFVFIPLPYSPPPSTPSDQAKRFAKCQFISASGKSNKALLALHFIDNSEASAAGAPLVLLLVREAVPNRVSCAAAILPLLA